VLGGGDTGLVEKNVRATQTGRAESEGFLELERGTEPLEGQEVCVEAPTSDDVAAGRRQLHLTAPRQQRSGEQDRRPNAATELRIERLRLHGLRVDAQRV